MLQTRTFNYASSFNYGYEYATNLGTLNIDDQAIFNTIMDDWEEVLAVDFESTMVSPELVIMEGDIDGDRGILGFVHYLDDGTNLLVMDRAEVDYGTADGVYTIGAHEIGHAIGFPHFIENENDLMYPYMNLGKLGSFLSEHERDFYPYYETAQFGVYGPAGQGPDIPYNPADLDFHGLHILGMYQAAFNRMPDGAGLNYWIDSGLDTVSIADFFIGSPEFAAKQLHGWDDFLNTLYQNVFDRFVDQGGRDFWIGEMASGRMDYSDVLWHIGGSPEAQNKWQLDHATEHDHEEEIYIERDGVEILVPHEVHVITDGLFH